MYPEAHSLAEQIAALDAEPATPRDTQAHLVASLTEQLAAGQSETLYSLHTAGAALRRQADSLQEALERLPDELGPALKTELAALTTEMTLAAVAAVETATHTLSTRLSEWEGVLERAADKHRSVLDEGTGQLTAAGILMTAQTVEAVEQIEAAAGRAAAEVQAGLDGPTTELTGAARQVSERLVSHSRDLGDRADAFAADARASADAVTAVGENVIARLIEVLDVRDQADKALEDRLNARIDRLTKRAETTVNRLIGALADEADVLRTEAEKDRESHAQQLTDLVDRLLAQPRGKLKDLRNDATKETPA